MTRPYYLLEKQHMSFVGNLVGRRLNLGNLSPINRVQLVLRLPSILRLSYRLMLDARVPLLPKVLAIAAILFVLSPFDVPAWIPVIGQAGDILVTVNILDFFIKAAPRHVVQEHIVNLGLQGKFSI